MLPPNPLALAEGFAVGALVHGGVLLVRANQDAIQAAVVLGIAMVSALLHGAFNALVCMTIHRYFLLLLNYSPIMCVYQNSIHAVAFSDQICYGSKKHKITKFGGICHG